jgi:hypothetical protein
MGFMDFISNIGSRIKETGSKIGSWITERVPTIIGKISGVARKIGQGINSSLGQTILDGLGALPIPGASTVASFIRRGGRLASTIGDVGDTASKVASGVGEALQGNLGGLGETFSAGRNLANQIQDARGKPQYNSAVIDKAQDVANAIGNRYALR